MATDMSRHFTLPALVRVTLPSIGMMLFKSFYVMTDGFFVANWCSKTALAAVNFAFPIPMILATVGFMFGTGGSAIVSRTRGEGDERLAQERFSLIVYAAIPLSVALAVIGLAVQRPILLAMGATGELLDECVTYGTILIAGVPFDACQLLFQNLLATAGKPEMGLRNTVLAGLTNAVLDAVLIAGLGWGVTGAAIGTVGGEAVATVIPLVYFARPNTSSMRFVRTPLDLGVLVETAFNGSSEFVSNVSSSIVATAYNVQLLRILGESGVAADSVIMYVTFAFIAIFIGFSIGCAPLMAFQYGAGNQREMRSLFRKSLAFIAVTSVAMFVATRVFARPLSAAFVRYDAELLELTTHAFLVYTLSFLILGFNIYGSSLFTSLGNGVISAAISFMRALVFETGSVMLLPTFLGPDGIWLAISVAETASLILTVFFMVRLEPRYGYARGKVTSG
ncbi:MAG: polysaccharide biosynthesis C-terminal domain-containing protein [Atopobiaceae bacterium]|nr:polysaccharide biosynthesis C-terminal domain-containing protein [Atopobiaceae bacterium]